MALAKIKEHEALDVSTELTAKYFRALGDPTRLRIPQSNVSNHLACLRWCGFVSSESQGKWTYYSVTNPKIRKIIELVRALVSANAEHVAACTRIDADA